MRKENFVRRWTREWRREKDEARGIKVNTKDEARYEVIGGGEQGGEKSGKIRTTGMVEYRRKEKNLETNGIYEKWLQKSCNKETTL